MKGIDPTYRRTKFTYRQLDRVLRKYGFTCRVVKGDLPTRIYEHKQTGALITMPPFPMKEKVVDYHLGSAQVTLSVYGFADVMTFAIELYKAGRR